MRFKIDQNLPLDFLPILADAGHDATGVFGQGLTGAPDARIAAICQREDRALITADLDLSDIRRYPPERSPGLIILRLKEQTRPKQIALLRKIVPLFATVPVTGRLWIVEESKVRVRGGPT